jgi:O-succinylbenzoic acid--CoA ligase
VWPELADAAARARLPISLTYGMTETAAMVTALLPEEFHAGHRSSGRPLPHAGVEIALDEVISVRGGSLFRGYFPQRREGEALITEDIGGWNQYGELVVFGRRDAMIITGGKKVSPTDVEAALRASGEFQDVAVIGLPDREWGEVVIACFPAGREPDLGRAMRDLAGHQRPKRFVAIPADEWPRNAHGKLNRATLQELASRGDAL